MLAPRSDVSCSKEVNAAAKVFEKGKSVLLVDEKAFVCRAWPALDDTQVFPDQILHFISTMFMDLFFHATCCDLPPNMWSLVQPSCCSRRTQKLFRRTSVAGSKGLVEGSRYATRILRVSCLLAGSSGKIYVPRPYYESVAYPDLGKGSQVAKQRGENSMEVTAE